jgi:hypothetical protein
MKIGALFAGHFHRSTAARWFEDPIFWVRANAKGLSVFHPLCATNGRRGSVRDRRVARALAAVTRSITTMQARQKMVEMIGPPTVQAALDCKA